MTTKPRWIASTIAAADACTHPMPWQRGARRKAMIERRNQKSSQSKLPRSA